MIYFPIKDYQDFKSMFYRKTNDGRLIKTNKILLAFWRSKTLRKALKSANYDFFSVCSIDGVRQVVETFYRAYARKLSTECSIYLGDFGKRFWSKTMFTDEDYGICEDGSSIDGFVRYLNERGLVYKKRIGRIIRECFQDCGVDKVFPEAIMRWYEELITEEWKAWAMKQCTYELKVNDDFGYIYDSYYYVGDFGSCMEDKPWTSFYENCVQGCKAAYVVNGDGKTVARAIIHTAYDTKTDKEYRLCDRQYGKDDTAKRLLVKLLIEGGHIDGYKRIGASCHDADGFLDVNDSPICKDFYIHINIDVENDDVMYMDSFKWYNYEQGVAYNSDIYDYDVELDIWQNNLRDQATYDEFYGGYFFGDSESVYAHGSDYIISRENLEDNKYDWLWLDSRGAYCHVDDVVKCPECGENFIDKDGYYSELTEEDYCCESCMEEAEREYAEEHGYVWSEFESKWLKEEDAVSVMIYYYRSGYEKEIVSRNRAENRVSNGGAIVYEGTYYFGYNEDTGLPYGVEKEELETVNANN